MKQQHRHWLVGAMAAALITLLCLSGCSWLGEPSSTGDLLIRYVQNSSNTNCVANVSVDVGIAASAYRLKMPIKAKVSVCDDKLHGNGSLDMSSFGGSRHDCEAYAELKGTTLTWYASIKDYEDGQWTKTDTVFPITIDVPTITNILRDAEFSRIADEDDDQVAYELTMGASNLVDVILGMSDDLGSFKDVDQDELKSLLKSSRVHVYFTKDCLIHSITLDLSFDYRDEEVAPVNVKASIDSKASMDGHDSVKPEEIETPAEVESSAMPVDDPDEYFSKVFNEWMSTAVASLKS